MIKYFLSSLSESGRNITGMWKVCKHTHTHGLMWWWFVFFSTFTILCGLRVQEQTENIVYFVLYCRRLINPTGITRVLTNKGLMCNNPERRWKKSRLRYWKPKPGQNRAQQSGSTQRNKTRKRHRSTVTGVWAGHDNEDGRGGVFKWSHKQCLHSSHQSLGSSAHALLRVAEIRWHHLFSRRRYCQVVYLKVDTPAILSCD